MRSKSKRTKTRKKKSIKEIQIINIFVFMSILIFFTIGSVILPKETVSEYEKRELSKFPKFSVESFFKGQYFAQIDSFYNDTFPFRNKFIDVASKIDEAKGVRQGEDDIKIYTVKK